MTVENFNLRQAKEIIAQWAKSNIHITKVYVFGSRQSGYSKKTGQSVRPDSDLDVAVEFDKLDTDDNCLTTWLNEADEWRKELSNRLNLGNEIKLHLEWYHSTETPTLHSYLQDSSEVIYERDTPK